MPDDLFGIDGLTVDDRGDLAVAPAGVEADAAAVEMAARRARAALARRRVRGIGEVFDFKRPLILARHEIAVEFARAANGIGVADALVQRLRAGDDDLVSAVGPQHRLDDALDVGVVARVVGAVAEHVHVDRLGVIVVAHDGNGNPLRVVGVGDGLAERARFKRHGAELGIEYGLDLHGNLPHLLIGTGARNRLPPRAPVRS